MYFDDRLATVLRTGTGSDRAACTQYRQLLDLLGTLPPNAGGPLVDNAYARLHALGQRLKPALRGDMIREPGMRIANPRLVATLAGSETEVASAAMAAARLSDAQWQALIPDLPLWARGFLRHRRDLDKGTNAVLERLGIGDLVLPSPGTDVLELSEVLPDDENLAQAAKAVAAHVADEPVPTQSKPERQDEDTLAIGALVRRIEAFQRARTGSEPGQPRADDPRLPLDDPHEARMRQIPVAFDFATDAAGRITWSDPAVAPMAVGLSLAGETADAPVQLAQTTAKAMRHRQPVHGANAAIAGAPAISGQWRIDATPRFATESGRFLGYYGRMRRLPAAPERIVPPHDPTADRMRQILHELRTPVNAIQGFAEIIQQQLYGPAPHEYRALAAAIAGDAARILAGFDELDRLARLESGALELDEGCCDLAAVFTQLAAQLAPVLKPRSSAIGVWGAEDGAIVPLAKSDAERTGWRVLAALAAEISASEEIDLHVVREGARAVFAIELPAALAGMPDVFSAAVQSGQRAISAGMFGTGFTLRLARAEARAAGGDLIRDGDVLRLTLPLLTARDEVHSHEDDDAGDTGGKPA